MKMENVSFRSLLKDHLKRDYPPDEAVLVIDWDYDAETDEGLQERRAMLDDLASVGCAIPRCMNMPDAVLIFGLGMDLARNLVNRYDKASFRMEVYVNGECIHENR